MSSFKRKLKRNREKQNLKKRIDELLDLNEMSRSEWKKVDLKVEGDGFEATIPQTAFRSPKGVNWGRLVAGHKPSLKSQYSVLWDLYREKLENVKKVNEIKKQLDEMNPEREKSK